MSIDVSVSRPTFGSTELAAVSDVLNRRWVGQGPMTAEFERRLAERLGAKHVVATANCTSALYLALDALELRAGDEVIVPSLTFTATVQAIVLAGGRPVFCEVGEDSIMLDVEDVARRITRRTRAIVPVHYAGQVCAMDRLLALGRSHGLRVIEDAAHAFGSSYHGWRVGSFGDVTCFSFSATKNITCGEGGAVATGDEKIADRVRRRRVLGIDSDAWRREGRGGQWQYAVVERGIRAHMSDINAAIGLAQLDRLEEFAHRRREIVGQYDEAFTGLSGVRWLRHDLQQTIPHIYVLRVTDGRRDGLIEHLRDRGIGATVHYPPNHLQPAFAEHRASLPVTERLSEQLITLPLHVELSDEQVRRVIGAVGEFFAQPVVNVIAAPHRVGAR